MEMKFAVVRRVPSGVECVPLTNFYELATPEDVIFAFKGEVFMAQTDLAFCLPQTVRIDTVNEGRLPEETLERIIRVLDGKGRGDGKIKTEAQKEFKRLEAGRWFPVASLMWRG